MKTFQECLRDREPDTYTQLGHHPARSRYLHRVFLDRDDLQLIAASCAFASQYAKTSTQSLLAIAACLNTMTKVSDFYRPSGATEFCLAWRQNQATPVALNPASFINEQRCQQDAEKQESNAVEQGDKLAQSSPAAQTGQ